MNRLHLQWLQKGQRRLMYLAKPLRVLSSVDAICRLMHSSCVEVLRSDGG